MTADACWRAAAIGRLQTVSLGKATRKLWLQCRVKRLPQKRRKPQQKTSRDWIHSERVDLVFYLLGDAPAGLDRVEDKINEILLEKANATVDFQFSTWTDWG